MALPEAIQDLTDLRAGINMMIYGDNGVGKTPLIATSPDCIILNADPQYAVMSARAAGSSAKVWTIRDWDDADEAHEYFRHSKHPFRWIWCDSISGLQEGGLEFIMENLVAAKPHRDRYVPDMKEYLQNMNRLRTWVRYMSSLPVNFGLTGHPFRWELEDSDEAQVWPWVQGKGMPASICGFMNVIGYLRIVKKKDAEPRQVLYTRKLPKYYARDRFGALPPAMENPTIPEIERLILKKVGDVNRATKTTTKPIKKAAKPIRRPIKRVSKKVGS